MWEYDRIDIFYKSIVDLNNELKKLGDDNWEIISFIDDPSEKFERKHKVKILTKRPKEK